MSATTLTAIAGLITALTALVHAFSHTHGPEKIPPKESDNHGQ